jgi:hypothetical protein
VRVLLCFGMLVLSGLAFCQSKFFQSVRPEALFTIKETKLGPEIVSITIITPNYSQDSAKAALQQLGQQVGSAPRGVEMIQDGNGYLRIRFAIDNVIQPQEPKLAIVPLVKAFGFAPVPIKKMSLFFEGVVPDPSIPARYLPKDGTWNMEAMVQQAPASGIEYRVLVEGTDVNKVRLPGPEEAKQIQAETVKKTGPDWVNILLLLLGAGSVGALVYFALLKPRNSTGRTR